MGERKALSKRTRFEVFKRDKFKCQYCGRSAPDIALHVDHVMPVSEGGGNEITNLVTSCAPCNLGKSNRLLSDNSVIKQQKKQLDELQERREQLEMMMEWQRSLLDLEEYTITELSDFWRELVPGYQLSDRGLGGLKQLTKKYDVPEILEAMKCSTSQYLVYNESSKNPTQESVEKACDYIEKICRSKRTMKDKPYLKQLYYARGILRNRLSYLNEWQSIQFMERAFLAGHSTDEIIEHCKIVRNWTGFKKTMLSWAREVQGGS